MKDPGFGLFKIVCVSKMAATGLSPRSLSFTMPLQDCDLRIAAKIEPASWQENKIASRRLGRQFGRN